MDFVPVRYTVSDGTLTLVLETCEEGGFVVTCPTDSELITQGETLAECFAMAYDAIELLTASRSIVVIRVPSDERSAMMPHSS